jgi:integrative and conjugative element protein (TIGR02256 family)
MVSVPDRKRSDSISAVATWIADTFHGSAEAEPWRLSQHGCGNEFDGWVVPYNEDITLLVAVDARFPYSVPITAVFGPGSPSTAPHVEDSQRLCTLGSSVRTDSNNPVGVVRAYIEQSFSLLDGILAGKHSEDYVVDFEAYWRRSISKPRSVWILGRMSRGTRVAFCARRGHKSFIVSENDHDLRKWLGNYEGEDYEQPFSPALFVSLKTLPLPSEYASNISDVRNMLVRWAPDALIEFERLLSLTEAAICLVFDGPSSSTSTGRGAVIIDLPVSVPGVSSAKAIVNGFRPGKVPSAVKLLRAQVWRANVVDVDASGTRRPEVIRESLNASNITILGCGSLGSGVAHLLAQSGVRSIRIFDPDSIGWENIGRHELGATHIGANKAVTLAEVLRRNLPSCEVTGYDQDWMTFADKADDMWSATDLIVSATADWGSDCALADRQSTGEITCPVVFGWMERNAAACHCVALKGQELSYRVGFDETGNAKLPVTGWYVEEVVEGCGALTSAYGAVELGVAQSHVASMALEILFAGSCPPLWRVAIGSTTALVAAGGYWRSWRRRPNVCVKLGMRDRSPLPIKLITPNGVQIDVRSEVIAHFNSQIQTCWLDKEAGGQLFANLQRGQWIISKATGPRSSDYRSRFGFKPDRVAEQEIADLFSCGLHYVGDWHTHPQDLPRPSPLDLKSMRDTVQQSVHTLPGFLMAIVGRSSGTSGIWWSFHTVDGKYSRLEPDSVSD